MIVVIATVTIVIVTLDRVSIHAHQVGRQKRTAQTRQLSGIELVEIMIMIHA